MQKLRQGDVVVVIAGRDKGRKGSVLARVDGTRLLIGGVNVVKRHARPNPMKGVTGGVFEKEAPIDQSNVMLLNPATGRGDRVGFRVEGGVKRRYFKSNGALVQA